MKASSVEDYFDGIARVVVGKIPLRTAIRIVRRAMVDEALRQSSSNKSKAASLLSITRQGLQQIVGKR